MPDQQRHHTVRRYRAGVGWWAACSRCPWKSEPDPVFVEAKAAGRVHELYPSGVDWAQAQAWR